MSLIEPIIFEDQNKYFQIKINAGKQIFQSGGVIRLTDLEYQVKSATFENESYKVFFNYDENRFNCSCPNWNSIKKYKGVAANCKHINACLESMGLIQ